MCRSGRYGRKACAADDHIRSKGELGELLIDDDAVFFVI